MRSPENSKTERLVKTFTEKAEAVSAIVTQVTAPRQAFEYVVGICEQKDACQPLFSGCPSPLSDQAAALCDPNFTKVIAAPDLDDSAFSELEALCREKKINLIRNGLRSHLAGLDIGFTRADYGIAETGTLVLDSSREDLRLATMIGEIHVALLPVSRIFETLDHVENVLTAGLKTPPNYTAFITGASRTADIERVLALGVHGPLELHILLLEDL